MLADPYFDTLCTIAHHSSKRWDIIDDNTIICDVNFHLHCRLSDDKYTLKLSYLDDGPKFTHIYLLEISYNIDIDMNYVILSGLIDRVIDNSQGYKISKLLNT